VVRGVVAGRSLDGRGYRWRPDEEQRQDQVGTATNSCASGHA
jgi:hypothetical protein